jgi:putative SOS response-associated peptidase YedK
MCGRYYRRSDKQRIAEAFSAGDTPPSLIIPAWDYNVAPTTFQSIIRADRETGDRELVLMRWGLVPFFTKQLSDVKGVSTINARAETVEKSPTWRTPFKKRRCLVPADGFYEWLRVDPKNKQPFAFGWLTMLHLPSRVFGMRGGSRMADGCNHSVSSPLMQTS